MEKKDNVFCRRNAFAGQELLPSAGAAVRSTFRPQD
jgi:hypothetical protein